MMNFSKKILFICICLLFLQSCQNNKTAIGVDFSELPVHKIVAGKTDKNQVLEMLGEPNIKYKFENSWLYVSTIRKENPFNEAKSVTNSVILIKFNGNLVSEIKHLDQEEIKKIKLDNSETKIEGESNNYLMQIMKNIGRFNPNMQRRNF